MIEISKVDGQISIQTTRARQSIQQPKPDFEMHQTQAKLEIHTEPAKVQINQQQCFNESGLMDPMTFSDASAQRGKQAVLEGIARRMDEGNQLAAIENKIDAVAEIAWSNSFDIKEYDLGTIPQSRPQIEVVGGTVDIRVSQEGKVSINSKPNMPIIDTEPGNIEISMKQYPEIHLKYIGNKIDEKI